MCRAAKGYHGEICDIRQRNTDKGWTEAASAEVQPYLCDFVKKVLAFYRKIVYSISCCGMIAVKREVAA